MNFRTLSVICNFFLIVLAFAMSVAQAQEVQVNSADPSSALQGTVDLDVEIKGSGFDNSAAVDFFVTGTTNPGGIIVKKIKVRGPKKIIVTIDVDSGADVADFDIQVRLSGGRNGKGTTLFSVKQKPGQETDTTPPSLITDFQSYLPISDTIRLGWTATGDDGNVGTADHYEIRQYEQFDPTACDGPGPYDLSSPVDLTAPWPREAGQGHEIWAEGLNPETCYAFSIQPFDEVGNTPGPSFTANVTQAAPLAGAWNMEVLPIYTYSKLLAFDPNSMQPVVFANDSSTFYFVRSPDATWTAQTVKKNGSGGISFDYNPVGLTFGGGLQSHRNVPSYAELQPDGSWDVTQITRDRVRGNSLAFDDNGTATVAFRTVGERILHLARYNGSSFDIETPLIPGDQGMGWGAGLKFDPVTRQPTIVYLSEDKQEIRIAAFDGGAWSVESIHLGLNFGSDLGIYAFEYGPNKQPVIIFRQPLEEKYERYMRMIRRDSSGNWGPTDPMSIDPDGMTIDPDGLVNQHNADLAIADDGTLYVSMTNTGNQLRVGRFCEDSPDYGCDPTEDPITGQNIWFWETVDQTGSSGGGNTSIAIDKNNSTVAIVAGEYFSCDPQSASVICGSPPAP